MITELELETNREKIKKIDNLKLGFVYTEEIQEGSVAKLEEDLSTAAHKAIDRLEALSENSSEQTFSCTCFVTTDWSLFSNILKHIGTPLETDNCVEEHLGFVVDGIYLNYYSSESLSRYTKASEVRLDDLSHEFTHGLISQFLGDNVESYWDDVIAEGFTIVLNNQFQGIEYLVKELRQKVVPNLTEITYGHLLNGGFFAVDQRVVRESFAYQCAAALVSLIDEEIRKREAYKSETSLRGVFKFIADNIGSGNNLVEDLRVKLRINIDEIEEQLRENLQ